MRPSLALLIVAAWVAIPVVGAQTAATQPSAAQSAAAPLARANAAHSSARSSARHPPQHAKGAAQRSETASASAGVALGATDITGNKELPKVMVIVPWKDSLGAGGVLEPTDSLMDEVLAPVDRSVFQRQIRYYGQLDAGPERTAAGRVAPAGDSH